MIFWDDLKTGQKFETDTLTLSTQDIIDYAKEFDPQPYHLDPVVAEQSIFGGHCASGWQVCALMMRLFVDTMNREGIPSSGSTGVDSLRWLMPVFAGDSLGANITISDRKLSDQHQGYGICDCTVDVFNQNGKSVIKLDTNVLIQCKPVSTENA